MPKVIQIRNVPDELHKRLKIRAAKNGQTLSSYVLAMAERALTETDINSILERVRRIPPDESDFDATAFIRQERDAR